MIHIQVGEFYLLLNKEADMTSHSSLKFT